MRLLLIALVAVGLWPRSAAAQATTSTILELPDKTIEVVGLQRWTPAMIQDSMNRYSPGDSLHSHACAATLRYRLGFAAAASITFGNRQTGKPYVVVAVVEPQDSARVRYRPWVFDTTAGQAPWAPLVQLARTDYRLLERAVTTRIYGRGLGLPPAQPDDVGADSTRMRETWAYLDAHATADDAKTARRLLAESPHLRDRIAAVAILSSFDREDATWWALAGALREPDWVARGLAEAVLKSFARWRPRAVDWRPAAADVHAVLNGTDLWVLPDFLDLLLATGAGPKLAKPFLKDGGHAVLAFAGGAYPWVRGAAHRFLRVMSGQDYGADMVRWRGWVAGL